jgi:hypothetical protein
MAMTCGSSADQLRRIALGMLVSSMLSGVGAASAQAPDAMASVRRQALSTVMAADFVDPPMRARPMYRFWNSGGLMTKESIETQVAQIKRAGAGGFEANQLVGIPRLSRAEHFDPAVHGFGSPAWTRAWTQLFEAGKAAGLEVDQIYTPAGPPASRESRPMGKARRRRSVSARSISLPDKPITGQRRSAVCPMASPAERCKPSWPIAAGTIALTAPRPRPCSIRLPPAI